MSRHIPGQPASTTASSPSRRAPTKNPEPRPPLDPARGREPVERSHLTTPASSDSALIIFAKAPIPGQVKTRLCPPLTPDEAATLHGSFVLDMVERSRDAIKAARLSVHRFMACAPAPDHVFFKILAERHGLRLLPQEGAGLGDRMHAAFVAVLGMGYARAVLVGSDLPSLPGSFLPEAFTHLQRHDLVLGPSKDGGYYLIGLTRPAPDLFQAIPWSTDQVLALTRQRAEGLGLSTVLLTAWRDVDTIDDVTALIDDCGLRPGTRTGRAEPSAVRLDASAPVLTKRTEAALRFVAGRLASR